MPEDKLSWYKGDYGFYGNNEKNDSSPRLREPNNILNRYKNDHIKRFDEFNSGLADNYSMTKGGALLSTRNMSASNNELNYHSNENNNHYQSRRHDLRSVWVI